MNIASVLQGLASFSWLLVVGVIGLAVVRAARAKPLKGAVSIIIGTIVFSLVLTTVSAGLVFIQADQRGVVISAVAPKGYREQALQPGLRWVIPFAENVKTYSISRQTYTMSVAPMEGQLQGDDSIRARTKDGQEVNVDASVIYSIDPNKIILMHIEWQDRYQDAVVRPLARGVIRDMASQYGIEEIVSSKRTEMVRKITDELSTKLGENNLILVDFILRDIHFTELYAAAVESKQIAEQNALQAEYVVQQKKQEAEQARQVAEGQADAVVIQAKGAAEARLIQAEAEAKALEMVAAVLSGRPELLTYQYITKLAPNVQVMFLPNNAPFIFPLPELQGPQ
ncbi:MAG: SPFH domain-containing protein [Anaerolineales bacterium]|nr:SPFH domain-containing protein [Anaerolineales bacterium]MDP3184286.1 SPFH domain-containing protein [Anaerolineales bacterium]